MTYDPYRQPQDPYENPYRVNEADREAGTGIAFLLALLILAAIGGFIYYGATSDQPTVANNEMRPPITLPNDAARKAPPETTGAGPATMEPGDRAAGAK